jgi:acetylornithine deacetylase/succinyl-diaminopimelate desuccinylase-like protein
MHETLQCCTCVHLNLNLHLQVLETDGPQPVVYADWLHAAGKPTILVYGHYDVQV